MRTLIVLIGNRFPVWVCQDPSIILAILVVAWGRATGSRVVVDAHNAAVEGAEQATLLGVVRRWSLRNAHRVLVTNEHAARRVGHLGVRSLVLPDPLPRIGRNLARSEGRPSGQYEIFVVCTWADDEPFDEILRAARYLPDCVVINFSGNSKGREGSEVDELPTNVRLLGFIDAAEYFERLMTCDVVIDLTSREDCLVCGAYEAMAAGQPLILSDTTALREHFRYGSVFTHNEAQSIADAIMHALSNRSRLKEAVRDGVPKMMAEWKRRSATILAELGVRAVPEESLQAQARYGDRRLSGH